MATHIAIEGQVPRPVNDIKTLLPSVSFPYDEITSTSGLESIIALTGYEPCTVGSVPGLAWNQTAVLGVATRSGGALSASYTATNLSAEDAAAILAASKQVAVNSVDEIEAASFNTPLNFADTNNTKSITLRPDTETVNNLTRLLLVAQNADAGITVIDSSGSAVSMTLNQAKQICAAVFETSAAGVERRAVAYAAIEAATTPAAAESAASSHASQYGP